MRDINRAEKLLSLFTSPDRAAAIAGDLAEERGRHGGAWFWRHVLGTAFSLGRNAMSEAPLAVLALVLPGLLLLAVLMIIGTVLTTLLVQLLNPGVPLQLIAVGLLAIPGQFALWSYGASLTGARLVAASPKHGMLACVLLLCTADLLMLLAGIFKPAGTSGSAWMVFTLMGACAPAFLLRGGDNARRRLGRPA